MAGSIESIKLELSGDAAAALQRLAQRLEMSPVATVYHSLNVLNRAVFPPLVRAASADPPPRKPSAKPEPAEVSEVLSAAEEIQELADDIPPGGEEFALSVSEKAADIVATIERTGYATAGQLEALENMLDGLQRWFHD